MAATATAADTGTIQISEDPNTSASACLSWGKHVLIGIAIAIPVTAVVFTAVIYAVAGSTVGEAAAIAVWVALWAGLFIGGTGGAALFAAKQGH